jgi:CIC family chloride channel protein
LIYIFYGADDYSSHEALISLKKGLGDPEALATNTTRLEGNRLTPAILQTNVEAFPFLGDKRLVIVEGLLSRYEVKAKSNSLKNVENDITAFAAILLKATIHGIKQLLTKPIDISNANWLYLIYPIIGILLAGLFVQYIVKDDISHGVTKILYAISQRKSRIKQHNTWTSIVASSITIDFGGSVGAEAPMVLTGSAIGSNLGRWFKMEQKTLMLLIGCGAASAIAGIFKAPIAGLLFTIEVLMLDLTTASVLPLLIASVSAASISYIFTGTEAMFKFAQNESFSLERIPYVLLLGVVCGLIALYFTRVTIWTEKKFRALGSFWKRFCLGAVLLSVLIFLLPPLYGEGYETIESLISNNYQNLLDNSLFHNLKDSYWGIIVFL